MESWSATSITTTGSGNAITSVSKSGNLLTFNKGLEFSLSNHTHIGVYEPAFTKNTAFNKKNFGTTAGTVAQGNERNKPMDKQLIGGNHAPAVCFKFSFDCSYR